MAHPTALPIDIAARQVLRTTAGAWGLAGAAPQPPAPAGGIWRLLDATQLRAPRPRACGAPQP